VAKLPKLLLRKLGYEIKRVSKSAPSLMSFLRDRGVDLVLDIGANRGQFGKLLRAEGYSGAILSFEPVKEMFDALKNTAARDGSKNGSLWRVFNYGLSDAAGEADINVSENSVFSSLHSLASTAEGFDRTARVVEKQRIALRRLDEFSGEIDGRRAFLKIDTQGHERQVLDGAGLLLRQLYGVQLELPITPLYQSTWTISDALKYMEERGFAICQITAVNKHTLDPSAFVDLDAIFRRIDPRLDGKG